MSAISLAAISIPLLFANVTIQSYICQPPSVPAIISPADGSAVVSSNAVTVEGSATADSTVELTDNGQAYATVTADQNNSFGTQATFSEGSHTLGVSVTNPCGTNIGGSVTITANSTPVPPSESDPTPVPPDTFSLRDFATTPVPSARDTVNEEAAPNEEPGSLVLRNIYPVSGSTTTAASVYVGGLTSVPSIIEISANNKLVGKTMVNQTSFAMKVPLSMGANEITITAISGAERTSESLKVIRQESATPSAALAWYQTTPGKILITSIVAIILLLFILLVILLR